jgi:hypothetical protein
VLNVDQFEWRPGPVPAGVLLEADRSLRSDNSFWVGPLPKYPYREGSDLHYAYQDAIDQSIRRGATGTEFNQTSFVMTMWYLKYFLDECDPEDTEIKVEEFMEKHRADLEGLFGLIEESQFRSQFDMELNIPSERHSFLQQLPLPENAREIWRDFLTLIGLNSD